MSRHLERTYQSKTFESNSNQQSLFAQVEKKETNEDIHRRLTDSENARRPFPSIPLVEHLYPNHPGYKAEGTSRDAAESVAPGVKAYHLKIIEALQYKGPQTCDELAEFLGRDRLYIRPRLSELKKLGLVRSTGEKRSNVSGLEAAVWEVCR